MSYQTTRTIAAFLAGIVVGVVLITVPTGAAEQVASPAGRGGTDEIAVLRYFRIKKTSFPEFHRQSIEKVWPYYEKAGARVVGMWQVSYPEIPGQTAKESADYDEVYLLTRYASLAHWQATRDPEIEKLGGQGPDLVRLRDGRKQRQSMTVESHITVLRGRPAFNGPYFPDPIAGSAR